MTYTCAKIHPIAFPLISFSTSPTLLRERALHKGLHKRLSILRRHTRSDRRRVRRAQAIIIRVQSSCQTISNPSHQHGTLYLTGASGVLPQHLVADNIRRVVVAVEQLADSSVAEDGISPDKGRRLAVGARVDLCNSVVEVGASGGSLGCNEREKSREGNGEKLHFETVVMRGVRDR